MWEYTYFSDFSIIFLNLNKKNNKNENGNMYSHICIHWFSIFSHFLFYSLFFLIIIIISMHTLFIPSSHYFRKWKYYMWVCGSEAEQKKLLGLLKENYGKRYGENKINHGTRDDSIRWSDWHWLGLQDSSLLVTHSKHSIEFNLLLSYWDNHIGKCVNSPGSSEWISSSSYLSDLRPRLGGKTRVHHKLLF